MSAALDDKPSGSCTSVEGPLDGESVISRSSHQSSSVMFLMPLLVNHGLLPSGAKK